MTRPPARFPARLAATLDKPARKADGATLRPQQPLQDAARSASASASARPQPAGLGLDSDSVRRRMVEMLRSRGLRSERVIQAMLDVPRHLFVDSALANQAYEDTSLPIGLQQTISKPSVVARMIEVLADGDSARRRGQLGRVLEIGSGCGYQAAVLARLSSGVVSVERLKPLHERAREHLDHVGTRGVRLVWGDGRLGHPPNAPYDSIIAAAGGDDLPQAWLDQMAVGGRLVAPMRSPSGAQVLVIVDRSEAGWRRELGEAVHFVPLESGVV
jgi:protein-L-isoaspartate(D-aspartate) O-methyltransferase